MGPKARRFWLVTGALFVTLVAAWVLMLGAAFAWTARSGVATVSLHDRSEGVHLWLPVPMALVDVALTATAVPAVYTAGLGDLSVDGVDVDLGELGPMVVALLEELESVPDATLVEVLDGRDHVKITKSGDKLLVEVEEPDLSVRVAIPASAVARIAERILG